MKMHVKKVVSFFSLYMHVKWSGNGFDNSFLASPSTVAIAFYGFSQQWVYYKKILSQCRNIS